MNFEGFKEKTENLKGNISDGVYGTDEALTRQLADEIKEFCKQVHAEDWKGNLINSEYRDDIEDRFKVYGELIARSENNFNPDYFKELSNITDLGIGELLHRNTMDYTQKVMSSDGYENACGKLYHFANELYYADHYEDHLDEPCNGFDKAYVEEVVDRIMTDENVGTEYHEDNLAGYVIKSMKDEGLTEEQIADCFSDKRERKIKQILGRDPEYSEKSDFKYDNITSKSRLELQRVGFTRDDVLTYLDKMYSQSYEISEETLAELQNKSAKQKAEKVNNISFDWG